jgi:thiol-disulfide isomerase/thioredoxin
MSSSLLSILLTAALSLTMADESFEDRLKRINREFAAGARQDAAKALRVRTEALKAALAEGNKADIKSLKVAELLALAEIAQTAVDSPAARRFADAAVALEPKNPTALTIRAIAAVRQRDPKALELYRAALAGGAIPARLSSARLQLQQQLAGEGKNAEAYELALESFRLALADLGRPNAPISLLRGSARTLLGAAKAAQRHGDFEKELESAIKGARDAQRRDDLIAELESTLIEAQFAFGSKEAAARRLDQLLANTKVELGDRPDDLNRVNARVIALTTAADLAGAKRADLDRELNDFIRDQVAMGAALSVVDYFVSRRVETIRGSADADPELAMKLGKTTVDLLAGLMPEQERDRQTLDRLKRTLNTSVSGMLAAALRNKLIGQPMIPLTADAWLNGSPLSPADLEGKVVLIDFWAVWCAPCIMTFPHLREWQEKYSNKGLVIIGVTNQYSFGWDEQGMRPVREEGLTLDEEKAACEKFLAHHKLTHRIAYLPRASDFAKKYGVQGIPQAVLIDRKGRIRLIKVGSGEKNAKEIEATLEKLLGEGLASN